MEVLMWMVWLVVGCQALNNDVTNSPPATISAAESNRTDINQLPTPLPSRDKRSSDLEDALLEELAAKTKRDPGKMRFNSWGGKRTRFSSWAGKREGAKRKFNSWGGKRSDDSFDYDNMVSEDKRAKFNSWGGKRAKFNSWGGKRNDYEGEEEKRAKFNSWGGKRADYDDGYQSGESYNWDETADNIDKRARFNSWGGKRSNLDSNSPWEEEKRAKFNSWGGKRNVNGTQRTDSVEDYLMAKRSSYPANALKRKQIFSSWGGKRTARSASPVYRLRSGKSGSWGSLLRPIRRGPDFYAWGGKRSV